MKKIVSLVLIILIEVTTLFAISNEEIEARIITIETQLSSLTEKIESLENKEIIPSSYGKIYGYTDQTWQDFKSWAEANLNIAEELYYIEDVIADGNPALKERFDFQISISDDNTLIFRNEEARSVKLNYVLVGNDINVLENDIRRLYIFYGLEPIPELEGIYTLLGTFSEDQSYITLGDWFAEEGEEIHLYLL